MKAPEALYKIDLVANVIDDPWERISYERYAAFKMVTKRSWWRGEYVDWEVVCSTHADTVPKVRERLACLLAEAAKEKHDDGQCPVYINLATDHVL